ncbi:cyclophilin-like family protein [Streptomyces rimosus]|uniref:cyclophilin-like family protein n=1 Tax=Streptomyces rimosus TaxID=1927 RepID=UPI00378B1D90
MDIRIRLSWPAGQLTATLDETPSATALAAAQQVVEPGTVAFWTEGSALALPYGPTPISRGTESRLASPCNVLGRLDGDPRALETVRDGDPLRVERA